MGAREFSLARKLKAAPYSFPGSCDKGRGDDPTKAPQVAHRTSSSAASGAPQYLQKRAIVSRLSQDAALSVWSILTASSPPSIPANRIAG